MAATSKDFYQLLGVPEGASQDEIRKAYRKLAKSVHPDANPGDAKAAERFKEIGEAYAVLSNEEKRARYDQMRKLGAYDFRSPSGGQGRGGGFEGGGAAGFSFEDLGGLGDVFSSIFDRGGKRSAGGERGRGPRRGGDVEVTAEISFETAVRGGKLTVQVPITEECATCSGSGAYPGAQLRNCAECSGTGTVSFGQGGFAVNRPCPLCQGRGKIPERPCTVCQGSGSVRQLRKVPVTVPPGVDQGSRLRVSGQGERGGAGGEPGDLILIVQVKPHRFFRREGADIHVSVPINLAQAALGTKIRVKTVDGSSVLLKIPAGTQSGSRFRIRGKGVPQGSGRGDQLVEVSVETPEGLTPEARAKLQEFAEVAGLRY